MRLVFRRGVLGVALALAMGHVIGCGNGEEVDTGGLNQPCHADGTCDSSYVCENGICVEPGEQQGGLGQPCYPDDTCDSSWACIDGTCVESGEEQGGLGQPCYPDDTCDSPWACIDGICECIPDCAGRECGPDGCGSVCPPGCSGGETCEEETGQCVSDLPRCIEGMCLVPAGPFMMGCNEEVDDECSSNEYPYREVTVPEFEIDENQVTVAAYQACLDAGACTEPAPCSDGEDGDEHPVRCVSWFQADEYCGWAGKRLCTEAEWEKAARGTDGRKYPWGNEPATCEYAVFNEEGGAANRGCGTGSTWPVGSKPAGASPYGVLDMAGNLFDWVEDDGLVNYEDAPTDGSAWVEDPRGYDRVARGGAYFSSTPSVLRASHRSAHRSELDDGTHGIRCCRSN